MVQLLKFVLSNMSFNVSVYAMFCVVKRSEIGRVKCNERTVYTVLSDPSEVYGARVQRGATNRSK